MHNNPIDSVFRCVAHFATNLKYPQEVYKTKETKDSQWMPIELSADRKGDRDGRLALNYEYPAIPVLTIFLALFEFVWIITQ